MFANLLVTFRGHKVNFIGVCMNIQILSETITGGNLIKLFDMMIFFYIFQKTFLNC